MAIASDTAESGSAVVDALTMSAATAIAVVMVCIGEKEIRAPRHQAEREHCRPRQTIGRDRSFRKADHSRQLCYGRRL